MGMGMRVRCKESGHVVPSIPLDVMSYLVLLNHSHFFFCCGFPCLLFDLLFLLTCLHPPLRRLFAHTNHANSILLPFVLGVLFWVLFDVERLRLCLLIGKLFAIGLALGTALFPAIRCKSSFSECPR